MTPSEFTEKMIAIRDGEGAGDCESVHGKMDDLMCDLLTELGYGAGVSVFEDTEKWYA